jgi:hypothetical protein
VSHMARRSAAVALAALFVAIPAAPALADDAGGPQATAARSCNISGQERRLGPTYVHSLSVRSVSCRRGKDVVRAYHRCRFRNGGRDGRCRGFSGWRCSERRSQRIRTQFDARARCTKGSAVVAHSYTQFT